jgi:hypothetical protein
VEKTMNFNKDNLITINKNEIKKNSKVIKIDDMYFLIGDAISSVKNIEYYKCVAVGTDGNKHDYSTDIIVSNSDVNNGDGRYLLQDANKETTERIWKHEIQNYYIKYMTKYYDYDMEI